MKHTKGPWYNNGGVIGPESVFNHSNNAVCVVGTVNQQTPQDTANARLITAVPDLYNALLVASIHLEDILYQHPELSRMVPQSEMDYINDAITKAQGGRQR